MSFVYELLTEIKWNENDENHEGRDLYHRFYNDHGEPKCNWTDEYRAWLAEICDAWNIPEGQFRKAWINDALQEAHETDLFLIKQWFEPEEEEEPDDEILEFNGGDDFKISMTKKEWYDYKDYTGDDALKAVAIGSKESQFEITYKPETCLHRYNEIKKYLQNIEEGQVLIHSQPSYNVVREFEIVKVYSKSRPDFSIRPLGSNGKAKRMILYSDSQRNLIYLIQGKAYRPDSKAVLMVDSKNILTLRSRSNGE